MTTSPASSSPPVLPLDGSTARTATLRPEAVSLLPRFSVNTNLSLPSQVKTSNSPVKVLLPAPGGPDSPILKQIKSDQIRSEL